MTSIRPNPFTSYDGLVSQISNTYNEGYQATVIAVNSNMVKTYWKIGQYIVDYEQKGKYDTSLLENLSRDLVQLHGKGFSRSNLNYMRLFYKCYPICETVSHKLNRSHIIKLFPLKSKEAKLYYAQNCR